MPQVSRGELVGSYEGREFSSDEYWGSGKLSTHWDEKEFEDLLEEYGFDYESRVIDIPDFPFSGEAISVRYEEILGDGVVADAVFNITFNTYRFSARIQDLEELSSRDKALLEAGFRLDRGSEHLFPVLPKLKKRFLE